MNCRIVGSRLQGRLKVNDRFVRSPLGAKDVAEVVMGLRIVRTDCQGLLKLPDRLVHAPLLEQSVGQIVVSLCEAGLVFQGLLKLPDRLVRAPHLDQSARQIVVGHCIVGLDSHGPLKLNHRFVHPPLVQKCIAEVVVSHRAVGIPREGRPPERFAVGIRPALPPGQHAQHQQHCSAEGRLQKPFPFPHEIKRPGDPRRRQRNHAHAPEILPVIRHKRIASEIEHRYQCQHRRADIEMQQRGQRPPANPSPHPPKPRHYPDRCRRIQVLPPG